MDELTDVDKAKMERDQKKIEVKLERWMVNLTPYFDTFSNCKSNIYVIIISGIVIHLYCILNMDKSHEMFQSGMDWFESRANYMNSDFSVTVS